MLAGVALAESLTVILDSAGPNMLKNVYQHLMQDKQQGVTDALNQALADRFKRPLYFSRRYIFITYFIPKL